ncbi:MAG: hypothetical protein ACRD3W_24365, partial [Terriglobales bacterium]
MAGKDRPVVAIWLDSADRATIEQLVAGNKLPHLQSLLENGAYSRLKFSEQVRSDKYAAVLAGCTSSTSGYWSRLRYDPRTATIKNARAYRFEEYPLFYAIDPSLKVCVFDVPRADVNKEINALQILG